MKKDSVSCKNFEDFVRLLKNDKSNFWNVKVDGNKVYYETHNLQNPNSIDECTLIDLGNGKARSIIVSKLDNIIDYEVCEEGMFVSKDENLTEDSKQKVVCDLFSKRYNK